ncbi:hypothetical protein [Ralstonia phage RP13]|nr:hypothetical protein [Ralstonia phage RP13]
MSGLIEAPGLTKVQGNAVIASATAQATAAAASAATAQTAATQAQTAIPPVQVVDYTALRAYTGTATVLQVTGYLVSSSPSGIVGLFVRDDSDTTSTDNGGTIIVVTSGVNTGKRYKRSYVGGVNIQWFGALGVGSSNDDSTAIQAATNAANTKKETVIFPPTAAHYKLSTVITVPDGVNIYALGATVKRYHAYTVANSAFQLSGSSVIYGMTYDGNASGINDLSNFTLYNDFNCAPTVGGQEARIRFDTCIFLNSPGSFILPGCARDLEITNNKFYEYTDHCIYAGNTANPTQNITVSNNVFRATSGATTREAIKTRKGVNGYSIFGNTFYLPNASAMTLDFGDVTDANNRNTRISINNNNGICQKFVGAIGSFKAGDPGDKCNADIEILNNVIDCTYFFLIGTFNWTQVAGTYASADSIVIQDNIIKGGSIVAFGQKDRPVRVGSGATATAVLTGNSVTSITVGSGGSGYTRNPVVALRDSTNTGFGAVAKATLSGGVITGFTVISGGINYTSAPTVYFEEYGINSFIVKNNTFLPREEVSAAAPGGITAMGDIGYIEITGNVFECMTSNYYGANSPVSVVGTTTSAQTRAALHNDVLRGAPAKPRSILIERNYISMSNSLMYEGGSAGLASDGSMINDYDTLLIGDNIFDLKFVAAGASAQAVSVGNSTRAKWFFVRNKQVNHTTGITVCDLSGPRLLWTTPSNATFGDAGIPRGSKTYDPPSVAAGSSVTTTVSIANAFLGDPVTAAFSLSLGGLTLSAYMSSNGTATCVFFNPTASAIDIASGTLSVVSHQ